MDHIFGEDWAGANAKLYGDPEYLKNIHLVKGPKDEKGYFNKMHNFDESGLPKEEVETNRGGIPTPKPSFFPKNGDYVESHADHKQNIYDPEKLDSMVYDRETREINKMNRKQKSEDQRFHQRFMKLWKDYANENGITEEEKTRRIAIMESEKATHLAKLKEKDINGQKEVTSERETKKIHKLQKKTHKTKLPRDRNALLKGKISISDETLESLNLQAKHFEKISQTHGEPMVNHHDNVKIISCSKKNRTQSVPMKPTKKSLKITKTLCNSSKKISKMTTTNSWKL